MSVALENNGSCLAVPAGDYKKADPVEMVIRAQKLVLGYKADYVPDPEMNAFFGKVKDRSYMGGEVSYFVELENMIFQFPKFQ